MKAAIAPNRGARHESSCALVRAGLQRAYSSAPAFQRLSGADRQAARRRAEQWMRCLSGQPPIVRQAVRVCAEGLTARQAADRLRLPDAAAIRRAEATGIAIIAARLSCLPAPGAGA